MSDEINENLLRRPAQRDPQDPWVPTRTTSWPSPASAQRIALRTMAEFREHYQVTRLRKAGYCWARIASWARVSTEAVHKKHVKTLTASPEA